MATTSYERYAKWYAKPENKRKQADWKKRRRALFKAKYEAKEIEYEAIPVSYRTFKK